MEDAWSHIVLRDLELILQGFSPVLTLLGLWVGSVLQFPSEPVFMHLLPQERNSVWLETWQDHLSRLLEM